MSPSLLMLAMLRQQAQNSGLVPYELVPGFSVSLPSAPTAMPRDERGLMWTVRDASGMYLVSAAKIPETEASVPADVQLAAVLTGLIRSSKSKLLDQKDLLLQGWLGLEARFNSAQGMESIMRTYSADGWIFLIVGSSKTKASTATAQAVLDSVHLPGRGPLNAAGPTFNDFAFPDDPVHAQMPGQPAATDIPVKASPGTTVHAARGTYGNRDYVRSRTDLSEAATQALTPEATPPLLEAVNASFASQGKNRLVKSQRFQWGDRVVVSTEFEVKDDGRYGRIDSFLDSGRVHSFVVMVPVPLKASSEVMKFFGSIRVQAK